MLEELQYPFDSKKIMMKRNSLLKKLQSDEEINAGRIHKKIAVLGGSTTKDIIDILNLFLLDQGIDAEFYESEYNKYWEDVMFSNEEMVSFKPDIIFIHTSTRNIASWPHIGYSEQEIEDLLNTTFDHWSSLWAKISNDFGCTIIQNNFEQPWFRLMGNKDASDIHGRVNFVARLNQKFYDYAQRHDNFFINDINYMASCYGLQNWSDPFYWSMYKYIMPLDAVPEFTFNLSNIIKSLYGKNKKAYALDLDNTLWGGVIGDDGVENIAIGQETATAELYTEFQEYLKAQSEFGIMLNIDSKNDEENALAGLARPDSTLKKDDFISIKANWNPKSENLSQMAKEINIGEDSFVFVDDNPAERHIIRTQNPTAAVPEMTDGESGPEKYIHILDRSGFFEVTNLSSDDLKRNDMYRENAERAQFQASFTDYGEYLDSLKMVAEIKPYSDMYMARIAQLSNKSNQFNLTTHRYTQIEIEIAAQNPDCLTLYGKLTDRFGDNGVVSVLLGHRGIPDEEQAGLANEAGLLDEVSRKSSINMDLWLMSCRVLKRGMEFAMMKELVSRASDMNVKTIYGYYYPTKKNHMVENHYEDMGFENLYVSDDGRKLYKYVIGKNICEYEIHMKIEK